MKNTYSIVIEATPQQVFHWLDDSQRLMEWLPNLVENEDVNVTENKVGSTFRQVYLEKGRRMEMTGVVTEYEANKRVACQIDGDAFGLHVSHQLEDLGGRTKLTQESQVRFKKFFKILGPIMTPFMKKSSTKQLEDSFRKLKELAEAGTPSA